MTIETYQTLPGWFRGEVRQNGAVVFETEPVQSRSDAREICENWIEQRTGRMSARRQADMDDRSRFLDEIDL